MKRVLRVIAKMGRLRVTLTRGRTKRQKKAKKLRREKEIRKVRKGQALCCRTRQRPRAKATKTTITQPETKQIRAFLP